VKARQNILHGKRRNFGRGGGKKSLSKEKGRKKGLCTPSKSDDKRGGSKKRRGGE